MLGNRLFILIFSPLIFIGALAQDTSSYISPMDIPLYLSGNFGELRRNHFHTGIDVKTQGRQKIPLRSIADGYVSRIKVSPYGYGNALYIDHLDGRTSVYAHMRSFSDSISEFMMTKQYEAEEWALDYYPEPHELQVSQGDIIGLSGNSGSSSGPHLHFEIRDTESEHPLNPLLFGFELKDDRAPEVKGVRAYPLDKSSHVENSADSKSYVAEKRANGNYRIKEAIKCHGKIGLAVHAFDRMTETNNKYGVFSLEMMVNGNKHYSHAMRELDFDTFRQINCHKDHELFHSNRWRYHKCFLAENNTLEIYEGLKDRGVLTIAEGDSLHIEFRTDDLHGNVVKVECLLVGSSPRHAEWPEESGVYLDASKDNIYVDSGLVVRIPFGRLYDDLYLKPSVAPSSSSPSAAFRLHDKNVPLDNTIAVSLAISEEFLGEDGLVMKFTDTRGRTSYIKGIKNEGWYEVEHKYLGTYQLAIDQKAPTVTVKGIGTQANKRKISLSIADNRSGVDSIRVEVNGNWLRMSYNASMSRAWGDLSEIDIDKGDAEMRIYIRDLAGNVKEERIPFQY